MVHGRVTNGAFGCRLGSMMISAEQQQWIEEQVDHSGLDKSKVVRAAIDAARTNSYFDPVEITYNVAGRRPPDDPADSPESE